MIINLETLKNKSFFINENEDTIAIPYKIDLVEMEIKYQFFYKYGGVFCEWYGIDMLKNHKPINTDNVDIDIDNIDEDEVDKLFKLFEKKKNRKRNTKDMLYIRKRTKGNRTVYAVRVQKNSKDYNYLRQLKNI